MRWLLIKELFETVDQINPLLATQLITADIYMRSIDKKGSVKTTTSGLKIDSLLVASSSLKLTRATKSWGLFLLTCDSSLT